MKGARTILFGVALVAGLSGSLAARAETLADAFVLAYRHSGLLEKNRAVLRAADEDVAQALAALRPVLNYTASASQNFSLGNDSNIASNEIVELRSSIGLSAELLLWDAGRTQLGLDVAKETVLLTRHALTQVEQQVLFNAVSAYLAVQEAQAFVNLRQSNVQVLSEQLRAARERFDVGEVTRTDVALAESQLAASRSELAASRGDLEVARAQYVQAVGQAPGQLQGVGAPPRTAANLHDAQAVARQTHPVIRRDMRGVTIGELNILRAEAAMKPRIVGQGSFSINQDYTENAQVGVQMTGPIYQGGALTSAYRQAAARRDEARADLHITVDDVLNQVSQAWAQREVATARIAASELQVRAARVAFQGLQEEFGLGARTTLDVLNAEQDLQDARAALISAQVAEIRAAYQLLFSMGLLTVEHLRLGITTYDPEAYYNAVKDAPVRKVSPQGQKLDRIIKSLGR